MNTAITQGKIWKRCGDPTIVYEPIYRIEEGEFMVLVGQSSCGSPTTSLRPAAPKTSDDTQVCRVGAVFTVPVRICKDSDLPSSVGLGLGPDDLRRTEAVSSHRIEKVGGIVATAEMTGSETFVVGQVDGIAINSRFLRFAPVRGGQVDLLFDTRDPHFFRPKSGQRPNKSPVNGSSRVH